MVQSMWLFKHTCREKVNGWTVILHLLGSMDREAKQAEYVLHLTHLYDTFPPNERHLCLIVLVLLKLIKFALSKHHCRGKGAYFVYAHNCFVWCNVHRCHTKHHLRRGSLSYEWPRKKVLRLHLPPIVFPNPYWSSYNISLHRTPENLLPHHRNIFKSQRFNWFNPIDSIDCMLQPEFNA